MSREPVAAAIAERLKDGVRVERAGATVTIAYALWEVALPLAWLQGQPLLQALLERRISRQQALASPQARPLVELLGAQGCFTAAAQASYSLDEVKALFDPLRSEWYASYYAHPAWALIRRGAASRGQLLAWLIHNYHLSRAAGVVAARRASCDPDDRWCGFFRQDALEEYWHCDAFYSLDTPLLQGVSQADIRACAPLPGSLAFEEHCLQVAERDPLGHLLIAYFQEASIAFAADSREFYREVEQRYAIEGLFRPWQQHLQIDVEQGHAAGLGSLLAGAAAVPAGELERALRHAWLAAYYLRASLDDILQVPQGWPLSVEAGATSLAAPGEADRAVLLEGLAASAFRALGFSREHAPIIACGALAKALSRQAQGLPAGARSSPWAVALANHLLEAASCPATWLALVLALGRRLPALELGEGLVARCERALDDCGGAARAGAALGRLDTLLRRWQSCDELVPGQLLPV